MSNDNFLDDLLPVQEGFEMFNEDGSVAQTPAQDPIQATRVKQPMQQPQNFQQPVPMNQQAQQPIMQQPVAQQQMVQQIQQPVSTIDNLTKLINKSSYTEAEWAEREQIYVDECNKIHIDPSTLTASEIAIAAGRIDNLLTPLRIDNIYAQRQATKYENQLKIQKELCYNVVKQAANGVKLTVDETKSLIAEKINNTIVAENQNLYDLNTKYTERFIFTKGCIDALQDKKDLLITYSAVLKIENTSNNFTASVPTQNQINRMGQ